jgi:putative two-component system response regulator
MDVQLPGMDGFEAVKPLKADPLTQNIPVIMITALDDQETKIRALQSGAQEFLTKPVVRVDLTVRVRNLLRLKNTVIFLIMSYSKFDLVSFAPYWGTKC